MVTPATQMFDPMYVPPPPAHPPPAEEEKAGLLHLLKRSIGRTLLDLASRLPDLAGAALRTEVWPPVPAGPPPPESPPPVDRWIDKLCELPQLIELDEIREEPRAEPREEPRKEPREEPCEGFPTPRTHFRKFEAGLAPKQFLVFKCVS